MRNTLLQESQVETLIYEDADMIDLHESAIPKCGANDIIVRNMRSETCGSDLISYLHGIMSSGIYTDIEAGREMVGIVDAVGENIQGIQEGSRVFIDPCAAVEYQWGSSVAGTFSQYVCVHNAHLNYNVFLLPDSLSFDEAVLGKPFSAILQLLA